MGMTVGEAQQQRAVTHSLPAIAHHIEESSTTLEEIQDTLDRIAFALEIIAGIVPKSDKEETP